MSKKHKKYHKSDKYMPDERSGSLKLVLKVGAPDHTDAVPPAELADPERRHKHKKKKKKHKHHHEHHEHKERKPDKEKYQVANLKEEPDDGPPPPKKAAIALEPEVLPPIVKPILRERKQGDNEPTVLQHCLDYIHKMLQRKDMNGFFAYPVTDNIAPGYSKIISAPMDLSTMKIKIDNMEYSSVMEYRSDFKRMCDNCMMYNHPETIYSKEAKKLLSLGLKQLTREKLLLMKRSYAFMATISDEEIGFEPTEPLAIKPDPLLVLKPLTPKPKMKSKARSSKFEALPDKLTPEQILAQASEAAQDARDSLTLRKPDTKFGFLRRRADGSTSLNIINPENDGIVSEKERVVQLGQLLGRLPQGIGQLLGHREDKRNKTTPVSYLNYGPFSSYAPVFDSASANLNKEDSDLLLGTYGDEDGSQYAHSLKKFVEDAGTFANNMVDRFLDHLTGGEHSKTFNLVEQKLQDEKERKAAKRKEEEEAKALEAAALKTEEIDLDGLRTLSDIGIDVTFLDSIEKSLQQQQELQQKLDTTSDLLQSLQATQYERLGQTLPAHLGSVQGPSDKEKELAKKVTNELADMVKKVAPDKVNDIKALRDAMGITLSPLEQDRTQEGDVESVGTSTETSPKDESIDVEDVVMVTDTESREGRSQFMDTGRTLFTDNQVVNPSEDQQLAVV